MTSGLFLAGLARHLTTDRSSSQCKPTGCPRPAHRAGVVQVCWRAEAPDDKTWQCFTCRLLQTYNSSLKCNIKHDNKHRRHSILFLKQFQQFCRYFLHTKKNKKQTTSSSSNCRQMFPLCVWHYVFNTRIKARIIC